MGFSTRSNVQSHLLNSNWPRVTRIYGKFSECVINLAFFMHCLLITFCLSLVTLQCTVLSSAELYFYEQSRVIFLWAERERLLNPSNVPIFTETVTLQNVSFLTFCAFVLWLKSNILFSSTLGAAPGSPNMASNVIFMVPTVRLGRN